MITSIYDNCIEYYRTHYNQWFKLKRLEFMNQLLNNTLSVENRKGKKILDVGSHVGRDFLNLIPENDDVELYGIDVHPYEIKNKSVNFILGDAEHIDFPDHFFDITVSIGVLEHIEPMSKLIKVIAEINRVSKSYCIIIPCISTVFEPHTNSLFWQLRDRNKKTPYPSLNYFSDEAWMQIDGFEDCECQRFHALCYFIQNLCIYKNVNNKDTEN